MREAPNIKVQNIKDNTLIARPELVSSHVAAKRAKNLCTALQRWPILSVTIWMDSMVALYWIPNPRRGLKVFVANRVKEDSRNDRSDRYHLEVLPVRFESSRPWK